MDTTHPALTAAQLERLAARIDDGDGNPSALADRAHDARPDTSGMGVADAKRHLDWMRKHQVDGADDMANAVQAMQAARLHMADALKALRTAERLAHKAQARSEAWMTAHEEALEAAEDAERDAACERGECFADEIYDIGKYAGSCSRCGRDHEVAA